MTLLAVEGLSVRLGNRDVLRGASLIVAAGEVVGLVGPNGAGKSTLMRAALGLIPHRGRSSLAALPLAARARAAAWLPQAREIAWPMTVEALVSLGRLPGADPAAVEAAIARLDLAPLRRRRATELSGGEQARVLIARALAQDTPLLMADEPAAGLDPAHQLGVMALFRALAGEGRGVLVSLHDLGLAMRLCDRVVVMADGAVVAEGPPDATLTPALLAQVFGIEALRLDTPAGPVIVPIGAK